ncbi:AAA family ATPase [bacterium]|nr:AAA family ATPase [bacterium]
MKPLVLRGARQVGKSTLARMVAEELGRNLVEVNFEVTKLRELNNSTSFQIDRVIKEIELSQQCTVGPDTMLFFDEIQAQPEAVAALRYFYEDRPEIPVVAAGSLLEVMLRKHRVGMPVGRMNSMFIGPMTFFDFVAAMDRPDLVDYLTSVDLQDSWLAASHDACVDLLKQYYYVGGMPESIQTFRESRSFEEVRYLQKNLLQTFRDDALKYTTSSEFSLVQSILDYLPKNLGRKVVFSHIAQTHSQRIRDVLETLALAGFLHPVYHTHGSGVPLLSGENSALFKLYLLDIGLYSSMLDVDINSLLGAELPELLAQGALAEQFVAQHLVSLASHAEAPRLYYWMREGRSHAAEVDFILPHRGRLFPCEVKSGATGKMRSLWHFVAEKEVPLALRMNLSCPDQMITHVQHGLFSGGSRKEVEADLLSVPLYAVENTLKFIDQYVDSAHSS